MRKRSSKKNLVLVLASLVFICCAFNLRLHSKATAVGNHQWRRNTDSDDGAVHRAISIVDGSDDKKVPTWSPTTNTTTWVPTYAVTTIVPTKSRDAQKYEVGHGNKRSMAHPRVACFIHDAIDNDSTPNKNNRKPDAIKKGTNSCSSSVDIIMPKKIKKNTMPSIPLQAKKSPKGEKGDTDDENDYGENDTCKYPDPSYQATSTAPSTCNDIHSLGFDHRMFENKHHPSSHRDSSVKYITMGGAKCVWKVTTLNDKLEEETVIFKSNKNSRFLKRQFWDQNRRDALISGGMGNTQLSKMMVQSQSQNGIASDHSSSWNHVLPLYHYCALANIAPYAYGNLEEYILNYDKENHTRRLGPADTLRLALQAARGLYQAQLYWDGKPTFVHADLNPSQFLVFLPYSHGSDNEASQNTLPILQINDFNQGRFLTRSIENNETCPFRSCTKNQRGNRYHTPERFLGCVDQDESIDTFSLGGVFFFLLTNGFDPYYDVRSYNNAIKNGDLPHIPSRLDLDHPAYDALKEVMMKCFAFKLRDRPSSLEVVQMLEEKLRRIEP